MLLADEPSSSFADKLESCKTVTGRRAAQSEAAFDFQAWTDIIDTDRHWARSRLNVVQGHVSYNLSLYAHMPYVQLCNCAEIPCLTGS